MKRLVLGIMFSIITLVLTACPEGTPPVVGTFTISGGTVEITAGSSKTVNINIGRTGGFTDLVSLALSGSLPTGVTSGGFNPTQADASSVLTLNVGKTAIAGSYSITVTGTAGETKITTVNLTVKATAPTTITVKGKVISEITGQPIANVPVVIGGRPVATTNAQGQFTITEVTKPYDITVVVPFSHVAIIYQGLTRVDPTINYFGPVSSPLKSAKVEGTVSGGAGYPEPANHKSEIAFDSPDIIDGSSRIINTASGDYSATLDWVKGLASVTAHALQWKNSGGLPSDYTGYGKTAAIDLADNGTFANQDISMTDVTEGNFSGNVTIPSGYFLDGKNLAVSFGNDANINIVDDSTTNLAFNYISPQITGATIIAAASASNSFTISLRVKAGLATNASGVTIAIPEGSQEVLPVSGATGVDTTTPFSWTGFANGVHLVMVQGGSSVYFIFTKDTSTTLPDLGALGLGLTPSTGYSWRVMGMAPYSSMDQAAEAGNKLFGIFTGNIGVSGAFSRSAGRGFVTAP